MVSAKRIDNGEMIQGYICHSGSVYNIIPMSDSGGCTVEDVVVDTTTIEPVAAPVEREKTPEKATGSEYRCPACGVWFAGIRRIGDQFYGSTPYCGNCGQRLDWSAALGDCGEGGEEQ
jgi:hypothetical protein